MPVLGGSYTETWKLGEGADGGPAQPLELSSAQSHVKNLRRDSVTEQQSPKEHLSAEGESGRTGLIRHLAQFPTCVSLNVMDSFSVLSVLDVCPCSLPP